MKKRLAIVALVLVLLPTQVYADDLADALALEEQGLLMEALEALQELLRTGGASREELATIHLHSAMLQQASGDRAAARQSMDRLLAVDSEPELPATAPPAVAELLAESQGLWSGRQLRAEANATSGDDDVRHGEPATVSVRVVDDVPGLVSAAALENDGRRVAEASGRGPFEIEVPAAESGEEGGSLVLEVHLLDEHGSTLWEGAAFTLTWAAPDQEVASAGAVDGEGPRRRGPLWIAAWTLLASGLVLSGAGGALVGVDETSTGEEQITSRGREVEVLNTDISGWVLIGTGGAAIITGVVLLILSLRERRAQTVEARLLRATRLAF